MALRYDIASRVQVYSYLSAIFQFIFDITILNTKFVFLQYVGIAIIFLSNIIVAYKTIKEYYDEKAKKT